MSYSFSPKQLDVIKSALKNDLGFINILEGSVRSGKTFSTNLAWTLFVINSPHDKFLMSGESTDSLYRNVIGDIIFILGEDRATYLDSFEKIEKVRELISNIRVNFEDITIDNISMSFGIYNITEDIVNEDVKSLRKKYIDSADKALYTSKENNKNKTTVY